MLGLMGLLVAGLQHVAGKTDPFDPSDGRLKVVLIASPIKKIIDPVAQQRANTWTVRQFEAAVDGKLAPQWSHRRDSDWRWLQSL